eukprot:SAG31_NODE_2975_length_4834_cov_3.139176_4_plen_67_part_01
MYQYQVIQALIVVFRGTWYLPTGGIRITVPVLKLELYGDTVAALTSTAECMPTVQYRRGGLLIAFVS